MEAISFEKDESISPEIQDIFGEIEEEDTLEDFVLFYDPEEGFSMEDE